MAVQIPQGYIVTAPEAIDNRLLRSKKQMLQAKDEWMPDLYWCLCTDPIIGVDGKQLYKFYYYSKDFEYVNDPVNGLYGRFRPYAGTYDDLSNIPLINGKPVKGSSEGSDYHLQNELLESEGILINRDDPLLHIISANIDNDTINFGEHGEMFVNLLNLFTAGKGIEIDSESDRPTLNVLYDGITVFLNSENELELRPSEARGLGVDSEGLFVKIDNKTIKYNDDGELYAIPESLKDGVATHIHHGTELWDSEAIDLVYDPQRGLEVDPTNHLYVKHNSEQAIEFSPDGKIQLKIVPEEGLDFKPDGKLFIKLVESEGVEFNNNGEIAVKLSEGDALEFNNDGQIKVKIDDETVHINNDGELELRWSESEGVTISDGLIRGKVDHDTIHFDDVTGAFELHLDEAKGIETDSEGNIYIKIDDDTVHYDQSTGVLELHLDDLRGIETDSEGRIYIKIDDDTVHYNQSTGKLELHLDGTRGIETDSEGQIYIKIDDDTVHYDNVTGKLELHLDATKGIETNSEGTIYIKIDDDTIHYDGNTGKLELHLDGTRGIETDSEGQIYIKINPNTVHYNQTTGQLELHLDGERGIQSDSEGQIYVKIDDSTVHFNQTTGKLELHLDTTKGINVSSEGYLFIEIDNSTIHFNPTTGKLELHLNGNKGVGLDSEGQLYVKVDNDTIVINSEGKLESALSVGEALEMVDCEGHPLINVLYDNHTIYLNSENELELHLAPRGGVFVDSEGKLSVLPDRTGLRNKGLLIDSEGHLVWGLSGAVDDVVILNNGSARQNSIIENRIAKIRLDNTLVYSEGTKILGADIYAMLPNVAGKQLKALTLNSEGKLTWGEAGKVDGLDVVEGARSNRIPLTNKYLKLNIGDGLDYTSEDLLKVDLKEVLPNMGGKAGKVLTVGSDGEVMWGEADEITNIAVYDGTTLKVLPVVNKRVTVQVERGLQATSEGKIGHINEITPQTAAYAANNVQFYIPKGTDNYGHIVDNATGVAEGLREVQFLPYDSNVNSWVDLQPATISGRQVVRATQKIKGYNAAAAAGHKYDNATLMLDADGLSANYKSKAQKLVATDATSEQLIIINGNELSFNQLALNRLQLLENAKGVIDSEGLANSKYYPTINLLKTELDAKQDLLTPIAPAFISSEGDSEGPNVLRVKYDNNTIILNNRGELKAKDVDLPVNGELSDIVPTEASEGNPLVDEDLMYDSLSSNLGIFRGNYTSEGELPDKQDIPGLLRNDYAFITVPVYDSEGNVEYYYNRYKYVDDTSETGHWEFEYRVSGSTFTRYQLNALNSRWNLQLTNVTVDHLNDATIHITSEDRRRWDAKQDALTASDHIDATALAAKRIKVLTSGTTITDSTNSTHPIETNAAKAYFKKKQTAVDSNSSTISSEGTYFISRITQNDQGVITPIRTQYTYSNIPNKPLINSVILEGNKYTEDIIQAKDGIKIDTDHKLAHTNSVTAETTGKGSVTAIPVVKYDAQGHITSVTEATVYPPTTAGTNGQVWQADGVQAGAWVTPLTFTISGVDGGTAATNPVTETFRVLPNV